MGHFHIFLATCGLVSLCHASVMKRASAPLGLAFAEPGPALVSDESRGSIIRPGPCFCPMPMPFPEIALDGPSPRSKSASSASSSGIVAPDHFHCPPCDHPPPRDECGNSKEGGLIDTGKLLKDLQQAESVDLMFMLDITGSMNPYIVAVKKSIKAVVDYLTDERSGEKGPIVKNLRIGCVGYRDFKDDKHFEIIPFTTKVQNFKSQLDEFDADGGGDSPEDVFGGLEKVLVQDWKSEVRVVLHVADATCHGSKCDIPGQDPESRSPEKLFKKFEEKKLKYNFGRITSRTRKMIDWFSEVIGTKVPEFDMGFCEDRGQVIAGAAELGLSGAFAGAPKEDRMAAKAGNAALGAILGGISKG